MNCLVALKKEDHSLCAFLMIPEYASVGYMAKRIQMRKNRFLALQKMAEQKKNEALNNANAAMNENEEYNTLPKQTEIRINMSDPKAAAIRLGGGAKPGMVQMPNMTAAAAGGAGTGLGLLHGSPPPLPHANHHLLQMQPHHLLQKHRSRTDIADQDYGPPMQPQSNHAMGHVAFNNNQGPPNPNLNHLNNNGSGMPPAQPQPIHCKKNLQKMMGISPSDIDKYSRIFFPVTFICFNLMYWIIYLHVSDEIAEDLVMLHG